MYQETLARMSDAAKQKSILFHNSLMAYLTHSVMAGVYVGFGVILAFSLSSHFCNVQSPALNLVMAATFGIALSLVVMAGADLFTGNTLIALVGRLTKNITSLDLIKIWTWSYIGNFIGAILLAVLVWQGDVIQDPTWMLTVAKRKMHDSWMSLLFKGILCNWLVVLAIWCSFRIKSEAAKLMMIWWCLLGFVGSGYEHSIANMVLLSLANFLSADPAISWGGLLYNLVPVTLGNFLSGILFMALPYYWINQRSQT